MHDIYKEAEDPTTSPQLLDKWAGCGARLRRRVAKNPNTPVDALLDVARDHWQEVLENPVLPLLLLENPGLPAEFPLGALRGILRLKEPPREFFPPLMRHPNAEIREAARLHRANDAVEGQGHAADVPLRGSAALSELLSMQLVPRWVLLTAIECDSRPVRRRALEAIWKNHDQEMLRRISWMQSAGAHNNLQYIGKGSEHIEPESLAILARGGPFARKLAARHFKTPPEVLAELAEFHQQEVVRRYAAANSSTPSATLYSLAATGNEEMRTAVARNKNCPQGLLDQLGHDVAPEVRRAVGTNRGTSPQTLARLALDADEDVRHRVAVNPSTEETAMRLLANDSHYRVSAAIARRNDCPRDVLLDMLQNAELITAHVASNNRVLRGDSEIHGDRLRQRLNNRNQSAEKQAVDFTAPPTPEEIERARMSHLLDKKPVPVEVLREAATHPDDEIRQRVAWNEGMPIDLLVLLSQDKNSEVRSSVAHNPALPRESRLKLVEDEDDTVRVRALDGPDVPVEFYERMARDKNEWVRLCVAFNKYTPPSVLLQIARDEEAEAVLNQMFGNPYQQLYENRLPDEAIFTVVERFPSFLQKVSHYFQLSPAMIEYLLDKINPWERRNILSTQNYAWKYKRAEMKPLPTETLLKMCEFPESDRYSAARTREAVVDYWAVTSEALEAIARVEIAEAEALKGRYFRRHAKVGTLCAIARHQRTSPPLLSELAQHKNASVRLAALENPNTPPEAKAARRDNALQTAAKGGMTARLCALSSPNADEAFLRRTAERGRWMERLAVARNTGAPRQILAYLCEDSNVAVAAAARETLRDHEPAL